MKRKHRLALLPPPPEVLARKRMFIVSVVPQFMVYADSPEEALHEASKITVEHAMFAIVGSKLDLLPQRRVKLGFSISRLQEATRPDAAHATGNGHAEEQAREPATTEEAE